MSAAANKAKRAEELREKLKKWREEKASKLQAKKAQPLTQVNGPSQSTADKNKKDGASEILKKSTRPTAAVRRQQVKGHGSENQENIAAPKTANGTKKQDDAAVEELKKRLDTWKKKKEENKKQTDQMRRLTFVPSTGRAIIPPLTTTNTQTTKVVPANRKPAPNTSSGVVPNRRQTISIIKTSTVTNARPKVQAPATRKAVSSSVTQEKKTTGQSRQPVKESAKINFVKRNATQRFSVAATKRQSPRISKAFNMQQAGSKVGRLSMPGQSLQRANGQAKKFNRLSLAPTSQAETGTSRIVTTSSKANMSSTTKATTTTAASEKKKVAQQNGKSVFERLSMPKKRSPRTSANGRQRLTPATTMATTVNRRSTLAANKAPKLQLPATSVQPPLTASKTATANRRSTLVMNKAPKQQPSATSVRRPATASKATTNRRSTLVMNKAPKQQPSVSSLRKPIPNKGLKRSVTHACLSEGQESKKPTRKSILKTPHKADTPIPEETSQDLIETVEAKGNGVRFTIPSGTPCLTPSKRKSMALTPDLARREKLAAWLISKGKTPTRYRHLCCFDEHVSSANKKKVAQVKSGLSSKELALQQAHIDQESDTVEPEKKEVKDKAPVTTGEGEAISEETHMEEGEEAEEPGIDIDVELDTMLEECVSLYEAGCPYKNVLGWLDSIEEHYPDATRSSHYWLCRARIVEDQGDEHATVSVFEAACRHNAQPTEEVAEGLREFVVRMEQRARAKSKAAHTPRRLPADISSEHTFRSSAVKYSITKTTPFFKKLHRRADAEGTPLTVVTPVRRSTRRSTTPLPSMLQDHDVIVDHLEDIPASQRRSTLFRPNQVIEDDIDEDDIVEDESEDDDQAEGGLEELPVSRSLTAELAAAEGEEDSESL